MNLVGKGNAIFVLFTLTDPFPALPGPPRPWFVKRLLGESPMSLYDLGVAFRRIAKVPRIEGVILHLHSNSAWGLADLQTLRDEINKLRSRGKRVVTYSQRYDLKQYYIATAANEVLMQPEGELNVCGLRANYMFPKDALESIGIEFDLLSTHPYKIAGDLLSKASPTPEFEEELNKIMDSWFDIFLGDISSGRNMKRREVQAMVDGGLYLDHEAIKDGYIDGIVNEEGLSGHLHAKDILSWDEATRMIPPEQWWWSRFLHRKYVALIRVEGMIVEGESSMLQVPLPFIGARGLAGDLTVVQHIRQVMKDKNAAAILLYIDSPGGVSTSTEAIASALREFNKQRPVVAFMNNEAASGGYYISTAADWVVSRPGTTTGSVGAVTGKIVNRNLYERLGIRKVEYTRGKNASISALAGSPYTNAQRKRRQEMLDHYYNRFASLVRKSRNMTKDELDAACQGRVWTGVQALEHKLVDEIGGLDTALQKTRELAGISERAPLVMSSFRNKIFIPPQVVAPIPAEALNHLSSVISAVDRETH